MKKLRLGLPAGSLQERTLALFHQAGYRITLNGRSYVPHIDDSELEGLLIRAQEIPHYVEAGVLDAGITGLDWIKERDAAVVEVAELAYSRRTDRPARWVLAVPDDSPVQRPEDLQGKRIATELVRFTRRYLAEHGVAAEVEFSWGATEVKVPELADAIVELTETGSSLHANRLRIVSTLLGSTPRLVAHAAAWADTWKREKLENLALLLQGALQASGKVGLKMNLPADKLEQVTAQLPALHTPTISHLLGGDWIAIEVIVDAAVVRDLAPSLKRAGAEGLVEYPLNKVIY